jgi:uncharacterized membrane protein
MTRGNWGHPGIGTFGHHFGGVGIAGMVLMIILWIAVIAARILVIRALVLHSRRHNFAVGAAPIASAGTTYAPGVTSGPAAAPPALQTILGERYARGEISREAFFQARQDLGLGGSSVTPPSETPPGNAA